MTDTPVIIVPELATILDKVRKHWNTGAGVEMWDNE
jgi:hypothetical protein